MPRGFETGRLFGLDLSRGIALLGMFAAHVVFDPAENVYDGRSAILFATVAGASLGLMTGGTHPPPAGSRGALRGGIALRGLALIVVGVFLTAVVQPPLAVILDYYGFALLLLVPLLFARRVVLGAVTTAAVVIMPALVGWVRGAAALDDVPAVLEPFALWLVFGSYPMAIWVAFLLTGLICARSDLRRRRTRLLMLVGGAVAAGAGYGSAVVLPGVTAAAHSGSVAEVVGSGGVAVAVIAAATLIGDLPGRGGRGIRIALYPVAAAGAMALTLYTAHAIGLAVTRDLVSGGGERWQYPPATLAILIVAALAIATAWRLLLGAGPLENLLRLISRLAGPRASKV
ncbi:MAG TPA: DUF418 domain-containing protein [Pseudolysinimonas sp.]|jgi:hypothetical protein|nr:DUF418 domain-containing protein [Pseudolysinimonas sp.]